MNSRKKKKQYPVIATCRRGLVCLGLICALQVQPLTILAEGSIAQTELTDSAVQTELTDAAVQVNPAGSSVQTEPADAAVQVNPAGSSVQTGPADSAVQVDPAGSTGQAEPADSSAQNITADPDTENTESKALVGQPAGVSLTSGEFPSKFDLCDLRRNPLCPGHRACA